MNSVMEVVCTAEMTCLLTDEGGALVGGARGVGSSMKGVVGVLGTD